jgi:hypothetical protein
MSGKYKKAPKNNTGTSPDEHIQHFWDIVAKISSEKSGCINT